MPARPTSAEAHTRLHISGQLAAQQQRVLSLLERSGPMTGRDINLALGSQSAHKRLAELAALGVIASDHTRLCEVTRRQAIAWQATGRAPSPPTRTPAPTPAQIVTALAELYALIDFRQEREPSYIESPELLLVRRWLQKRAHKHLEPRPAAP